MHSTVRHPLHSLFSAIRYQQGDQAAEGGRAAFELSLGPSPRNCIALALRQYPPYPFHCAAAPVMQSHLRGPPPSGAL